MLITKVLCVLFVVLSLSCAVFSHTVKGTISNDTNMTFSLTKSEITHGQLSTNPATILEPYANTDFELSSPIWNDRIEYSWGYTSTMNWCNNIPSQITGTYKYSIGLNKCTTGDIICPGVGNQTVIFENCDDAVGDSEPTFYIL